MHQSCIHSTINILFWSQMHLMQLSVPRLCLLMQQTDRTYTGIMRAQNCLFTTCAHSMTSGRNAASIFQCRAGFHRALLTAHRVERPDLVLRCLHFQSADQEIPAPQLFSPLCW